MKHPFMTVFGLNPLSKNIAKFYIPHYAQIPNIYKNSCLRPLDTDSVMYTKDAWGNVDFWNSDADVLYAEDSLSFVEALNYSGNHYGYFDPFLKLYRVAHSNTTLNSLGKDKNDHHVLDILANFLRADCIWVSPILADRLKPVLKGFYSRALVHTILDKTIILPYPGFYKSSQVTSVQPLTISSKKPLVFLWNHRLVENKNFKDFVWILTALKKEHPDIPFKILFVCAESEESIRKALPVALHPNMKYVGYVSDKAEYTKAIKKANITIATSKLESFGNAVFDSIANGILLINQDCNDAFVSLVGPDYTYSKKEIPDAIAKAYKSKSFREKIHEYNTKGMQAIPSAKKHYTVLSQKLSQLVQVKQEQAPTLAKSRVLQQALSSLEKQTLTKQELFKAIGWSTGKNPVNAHWAGYYYALRREGVQITVKNGTTYYHLGTFIDVSANHKTLWGK
jgi:glycosyltransferase involved in cell wall biosynthesis